MNTTSFEVKGKPEPAPTAASQAKDPEQIIAMDIRGLCYSSASFCSLCNQTALENETDLHWVDVKRTSSNRAGTVWITKLFCRKCIDAAFLAIALLYAKHGEKKEK